MLILNYMLKSDTSLCFAMVKKSKQFLISLQPDDRLYIDCALKLGIFNAEINVADVWLISHDHVT